MTMFRALESFFHNPEDGMPEVFIADGKAYDDSDPRIRKVIEKFPQFFSTETAKTGTR